MSWKNRAGGWIIMLERKIMSNTEQYAGNLATVVYQNSFHGRQRQKQALASALVEWAGDSNLFMTFKFAQGSQTSEERALKALCLFWNKMDRIWYSKSQIRHGYRIPRVCFIHKGSSGKNVHVHALAEVTDVPVFNKIAKNAWASSDKFSFDLHIEPVRNLQACCNYLTHEYTKLGSDSFLGTVSHIPANKCRFQPKQTMSQLKRLLQAHYR
jgi:hypothetical protein